MPNPKQVYKEFLEAAEQIQQNNHENKFVITLISEFVKRVKNPDGHKYTQKDITSLNEHIKKMASNLQKNTNRLNDNQIGNFQKIINKLVSLQDSINEKLKFKSFDEPKKRSVVARFSSIFHSKKDTKPTLEFRPDESPKHKKK